MFVFCCFAFTGVQGVSGATYYIDYGSGNDANNGTSTSTPWKHFPTDARATANAVAHTLMSGDTYIFKRGVVYNIVAPGIGITNATTGITVTSQAGWGTGERAILDGGKATMVSVFKVSGTTNTTISNMECRNVEGNCFDIYRSTNVTLSNLAAHTEATTAVEAYGIYMHSNMYGSNYINDCEVYNCKNYGLVTGNLSTGTIEINRCISHNNATNDGFRDSGTTSKVTYNDCVAYGNAQDGWDLYNTTNKTINRCISYNNGASGFKLGPSTGGNSIRYSIAYGNPYGFRSNTGDNYLVYNNVAYKNGVGYEFYYGGGTVLKNNIGYNNTVNLQQNSLSNVDENNIWYQDSATGVNVVLNRIEYHNNDLAAYRTASGRVTNTLFSNPVFVNAPNHDFQLLTSSPAIDKGIYVGITSDFKGNSIVGNPDIGAFEYQSITSTTSSTPPPLPNTGTGTSATIPTAPNGLNAVPMSSSRINLTWSDNAGNETGYKVEQCAGDGCTSFTLIATVGANVTSYSSSGLNRNTIYRYRVRAYNAVGNSAYSNVVTAKTRRYH